MIGIVIPTRGDRSVLLKRCLEMMYNQTMMIDHFEIVDEEPKSDEKDITYRYRKGLTAAFKEGCEVVFLIEDDDWYSNRYIEIMYNSWEAAGKPQIFGSAETIYYHLKKKEYMTMTHPNRSSAFSTMVTKAVMAIDWPDDNYSFLDIELWRQLKGKTALFSPILCMGIKHGIGVCGGKGHNDNFHYTDVDPQHEFLEKVVGSDFQYYSDFVI